MKILILPVEIYPVFDVKFKAQSEIGEFDECWNYDEIEVPDDFAENAKRVFSEYKHLQEELKAIYYKSWEEGKRKNYTGVQVSKAASDILECLNKSDAKLNL